MIVAQLSDIHAAPGNDNLSRLERAVIWLRDIDLHAVVLSGDLIDDGWTEGYDVIADHLAQIGAPVMALPGNSDDRIAMRRIFPLPGLSASADAALHFSIMLEDLQLVGMDVCVDGASHGDIIPHLDWLQQTIVEDDKTRSLVFLHHHLFPTGIPPVDRVMAEGADKLNKMLAGLTSKPHAISSGHVHHPLSAMLGNVPAHICGSICPANPLWFGSAKIPRVCEAPMLMIHRITGGSLVSSHVCV